ncbi:MAG TPA: glycoside hydrolase family 9 protein, partial [Polyangiaceae bacterium]|nr:glycoside hydrolase family 9 protein [Polyangiaceae bacterium]
PHSIKIGVAQSAADTPLEWHVVDASDDSVASGKTQVGGSDEDSGAMLHRADFSALTAPGKDYRLVVDGASSYRFSIDARVYRSLELRALNFFYQMRSGTPIEIPWAGQWQWTHGPGHLSDAQVPCADGCGYTLNVLGGWYDAGDHGKYVVNGGIATWTLLNTYERARYLGVVENLKDGTLAIPENANGVPDVLDEARWEIEFLLKMQVPQGYEKAGMAHHKIHDAAWTTLGRVPPETATGRALYPPSTAATLNLAAVAAQAARIWREFDPEFSERCRLAAIRAWNAAQKFPAVYAPQYANMGGGPYDDTDVSDELYWAAAELFITLGSPDLLAYLRASPHHGVFPSQTGHEKVRHQTAMTWQATAALGAISLSVVPHALPDEGEVSQIRSGIERAADVYLGLIAEQGYRVPIRAGENGHYPWGSNSLVANNAIVMALAYDFTHDDKYAAGVVHAADYLLGRNPLAFSYVSGFGENSLSNPHHRFWAHQKRSSFPHPPPGALAGGPNSRLQDPTSRRIGSCPPQRCYIDHVDAWSVNEVAINWNAPLAWVAAFLDERGGAEATPDPAPPGQ